MATKLEMMQAVAKDCNRVLRMDPPIPVDLKTTEAMKKALLKEMDGELYDVDEENLKPETFAFLTNNLGIKPQEAPNQVDAVDPQHAIPEKKAKPKAGLRARPPKAKAAVEEKATQKEAVDKEKGLKKKKSEKKDNDISKTRLIINSVKKELNKKTPNLNKGHLCENAENVLEKQNISIGSRSYTRLVVSIILDTLSEFDIL